MFKPFDPKKIIFLKFLFLWFRKAKTTNTQHKRIYVENHSDKCVAVKNHRVKDLESPTQFYLVAILKIYSPTLTLVHVHGATPHVLPVDRCKSPSLPDT